MKQSPSPGSSQLTYCGDEITIRIELPEPRNGKAWLRTNLGNASVLREEIIAHTERGEPFRGHDWSDLPMEWVSEGRVHTITLPLRECGRFEAKAYFLEEGSEDPIWAEGKGNSVIHVAVPWTVGGNGIYAAFPRLFGDERDPYLEAESARFEKMGGEVIRPSGRLRDLESQLDHIVGDLRFGILLLLPVFPVPTTLARMGRYGSPFASIDFFSIDPALSEFDRKSTPLAQFIELLDGVHRRGARLFMDVPINHTGWASSLQTDHPDWFVRKDDGIFVSPGVWDVQWMDLFQLDYSKRELRMYIAGVFLFWCRQGVDGFRCDAGHLLPVDVWVYIIAKVRREFPETVFLLEGLGSTGEVSAEMRGNANFDWDYSELFQQHDRGELDHHLPRHAGTSASSCLLIHFAETHDNARLAAQGHTFARMRTAVAALCSTAGGWGITCGVEWFADEKINVHNWTSMRWGREPNQVADITRLNALLSSHPAFQKGATQRLVTRGDGEFIALVRHSAQGGDPLLILINLDAGKSCTVGWAREDVEESGDGRRPRDLLSGRELAFEEEGGEGRFTLEPGAVVVVASSDDAFESLEREIARPMNEFKGAARQRLRSLAMKLGTGIHDADLERFRTDPAGCLGEAGGDGYARVTRWSWERDTRRVVLIPPGHALLITAPCPFRVLVDSDDGLLAVEQSHARTTDGHFTVIGPGSIVTGKLTLSFTVFDSDGRTLKSTSKVLALPAYDPGAPVALSIDRSRAVADRTHALCTNGRGAMAQARAAFGDVRSQYDCFLAANLDPRHPVDRKVKFTRCRVWVAYLGRSRAVDVGTLEKFTSRPGGGVIWDINVPLGGDFEVPLRVSLEMRPQSNAVDLKFSRRASGEGPESVKLIVRPDVEDRDNHHKTGEWDAAAMPLPRGFRFPEGLDHPLEVVASQGEFVPQPEWLEGIHHPVEAERGLDDRSDLFSPGYFEVPLARGESVTLEARIQGEESTGSADPPGPDQATLSELARIRLDEFIVARDDSLTVIAGYPWFLDWGRDTLIFLRGVIAAGRHDDAASILDTFARFEDRGTLPNMIRGGDASDRDTSDAPLWFIVACADLASSHSENAREFLASKCDGRSVVEIIRSIIAHYMEGTPNGIRMDPESGLIYSPPHFTWMDTNYPPGTPRGGYPIEIQALWIAALTFMHKQDSDGEWASVVDLARESIGRYFACHDRGYLSDCLHCAPGDPASVAVPDDHLRSNQLFAVTLGAVIDEELSRAIVGACEELLVPGAIRSLADRPVSYPLPYEKDGHVLNDPHRPYWGQYGGAEDFTRKPAYHNGTAWTWTFPSWAEALDIVYGEAAREAALAILSTSAGLFESGSLGQIPEILDGDAPHAQKGCGAQAWGVSELYRVLSILDSR